MPARVIQQGPVMDEGASRIVNIRLYVNIMNLI